jgi:hypothetical protein
MATGSNTWNTPKLSDSHSIGTKAEDGAGNATSTSLSVTVGGSTKGSGGSKGGGRE